MENPLGYRTSTVYSDAGRVAADIDALGYRTSFSYDVDGRPVAVTNPISETTTIYRRMKFWIRSLKGTSRTASACPIS